MRGNVGHFTADVERANNLKNESYKRHCITRIERTRSAKRRSVAAISGHVADNYTTIRAEKPLPAPGSKSMFVPAFMVSNVQSLSPKIDEVRVMISNANLDFACITETWLKDHINDHTVSVSGCNIIRRDREVIDHGGVCMYVRESMRFETLSDFMDENFEVLWVRICPPRLPRGVSSIVVGTVYHPPRTSLLAGSPVGLKWKRFVFEILLALEKSRRGDWGRGRKRRAGRKPPVFEYTAFAHERGLLIG